jgi:hypothetical protein
MKRYTIPKIDFPILLFIFAAVLVIEAGAFGQSRYRAAGNSRRLPGFNTNTDRRSVEPGELVAVDMAGDGTPAIDEPDFVDTKTARFWIKPDEPVVSLTIGNESRAYPLQILIWHEIVNDTVSGVPVAVTFSPLCYSANVFLRRLGGTVYEFGVSGFLRQSNMVMFDRQTETMWQQITGEAIIGDLTGRKLALLPSQIISFEQFSRAYPDGRVLSRRTGFRRNYGRNPYAGYDDVSDTPFNFPAQGDKPQPKEKLIAVGKGDSYVAYPYSAASRVHVIEDEIAGEPVVVFYDDDAVSALDNQRIAMSRRSGSTGVFDRRIGDLTLNFSYHNGMFYDQQTQSIWDITGQAVDGEMKGKKLRPIAHGDYFSFAWITFRPETSIFRIEE